MKELVSNVKVYGLEESIKAAKYPMSTNIDKLNSDLTEGIKKLAQTPMGEGHNQYLTGITVQFDLTCSNKMWVEMERYRFVYFVSSQSTMHRIARFNLNNQYNEYVDSRIVDIMREKVADYNAKIASGKDAKEEYLEILYSNPSGFTLTARLTTNYRELQHIYRQRKTHRLPEWREFCSWIETLPYSKELIIGEE